MGLRSSSLEIYEKHGPKNRLVEALLVKDLILPKSKAPHNEVVETLQRTYQKALELGRPLACAQSLELLGDVFTKRRDLNVSRDYYEASHSHYETIKTTNIARRGMSRCQSHRSRLVRMQENSEIEWRDLLIDRL